MRATRLALASTLLLSTLLVSCPRPRKNDDAPTESASVDPKKKKKPTPADAGIDTVSQASAPWDDPEPIAIAGEVDGAALRAKNRARLGKDRSPVTVLRGDGPLELGRRICEAVVPKRPASTPVLLKPNLGGFDWFKSGGADDGVKGRITSPEFVRGVIRCLKARGHAKITVAEGWGATHKDWLRLVDVSGYAAMTAEEGVPLVAMDDDGVFDHAPGEPGKPLAVSGMEKTGVPTLLMPKILAEHLQRGLFISLPKVKAHRFGVVSISVKGVQGTIMLSDGSPAFRQKWRMHRELNAWLDGRKKGEDDRALYVSALETFAERIADVLEVEAPHVVLADAAPAMSGDGFQKLRPSEELVALGGTNPVAVDRVGAQLLGLFDNAALGKELGGHTTSPLIERAARRFGLDLHEVVVTGDGASLLDHPRPTWFVGMAPFTIEGTSGAPSASSGASSGPSAEPRPEAHAAALGSAALAIDGKGDDPPWAKARPVRWSTDWSGADAGIETEARFLWSDRGLHALFALSGAHLFVDTSFPVAEERKKLYVEDCVELFLDTTPGSPKSYHEIEVGPFGHFFDLAIDGKKSDLDWSAGLTIGATRDEQAHTATIELTIAAPAVRDALAAGARLPFALYRMEGESPRRFLAWSPTRTKTPNFHVPDAFGALVLDP
jgi:uncharacterized protein (DUF362 family)